MDKIIEGMFNNSWKIIVWIVIFTTGLVLGATIKEVDNTQKKYKMNLKCIQGELYEEVRTNMFVKSHLECFEQRTF
jgi:mannosyltransferase OCH1-like enzyme